MNAAKIRNLKPGELLFKEGDQSKSLFIIKKGSIGIRKIKGGAYVELARVYTNEILGELSFFDRLPRSATAVALVDTDVVEVSFESLDKIYDTIPTYMKSIIASLADRLRKANDTIRRLQKNVVSGETVPEDGKKDDAKDPKDTKKDVPDTDTLIAEAKKLNEEKPDEAPKAPEPAKPTKT